MDCKIEKHAIIIASHSNKMKMIAKNTKPKFSRQYVNSPPDRSPFDVPGVKTRATTEDILETVRESRARDFGERVIDRQEEPATPQK